MFLGEENATISSIYQLWDLLSMQAVMYKMQQMHWGDLRLSKSAQMVFSWEEMEVPAGFNLHTKLLRIITADEMADKKKKSKRTMVCKWGFVLVCGWVNMYEISDYFQWWPPPPPPPFLFHGEWVRSVSFDKMPLL